MAFWTQAHPRLFMSPYFSGFSRSSGYSPPQTPNLSSSLCGDVWELSNLIHLAFTSRVKAEMGQSAPLLIKQFSQKPKKGEPWHPWTKWDTGRPEQGPDLWGTPTGAGCGAKGVRPCLQKAAHPRKGQGPDTDAQSRKAGVSAPSLSPLGVVAGEARGRCHWPAAGETDIVLWLSLSRSAPHTTTEVTHCPEALPCTVQRVATSHWGCSCLNLNWLNKIPKLVLLVPFSHCTCG